MVITGKPNSLALDYIHDNIYWIDIKSKTINVMNILDENSVYIVSRLEDENPRDLIINMKRSALVWSDVGSDPKIMYSNLDGSERKVLYSESRQAMHLTIDYENERYFFIDITDHSLYSIDFNGNDEKFFIQSTLFLDIINSMTVLNNDLYLANEYMIYRIPELDLHLKKSQVLYKVHYFPNFELDDFIMTNAKDVFRHKINGFRILDPIQQPVVDNRCEANICQGLCLPNANSYRCLDSDEMAISPSQLALKDLDDSPNTLIYREKSTNTLSIFNLIFFFLLLLIIALMSFSIFRYFFKLFN